jgi:V8-like Glu-specific endopeptidase
VLLQLTEGEEGIVHVKNSPIDRQRVAGLGFALTTCAVATLLAGGLSATGAPAYAADVRHLISDAAEAGDSDRRAAVGSDRESRAAGGAVLRGLRGDPLRYWTPERYRNAQPMELPKVDALDLQSSSAPRSARRDSPWLEPGSPPAVDLEPNPEERLFELVLPEGRPEPLAAREAAPIDPAELLPYSRSPDGALYTSSRVFPPEALLVYPYATTGRLFAFDPQLNVQFICSAAVVQRRLIATAGHCVYEAERGYWRTDFVFVPAYAEGTAPFGAWGARAVITTTAWVEGGGTFPNPADFAILVLDEADTTGGPVAIGEVTGWLSWASGLAANSHVTMLGYPGNLDGGERMQQTHSQTFELLEPNAALFGTGLSQGSSGGPYIMNFGQLAAGQIPELANVLVGIMSFGLFDRQLAGTSIINGDFEEVFNQACEAEPGNCGDPATS